MIFHWLIQRIVVKRLAAAHLWLCAFLWKCLLGSVVVGAVHNPGMSTQTPSSEWCGERCVCGTVTGMFASVKICLRSRGADVASCNNKYCCLISCAEVLTGTGLKYAFQTLVWEPSGFEVCRCVWTMFSVLATVCVGLDFFYYRIPCDAGKRYLH